MGVTRAEGFLNNVLHDEDGNEISSTTGTSSTGVVADGIRRLCVDAFLSGGSIPITPPTNQSSWTVQTNVVSAGNPTQGPNITIPDGYSVVVRNRSTNGGVGNPTVFVATSLVNTGVSASRIELLKSESLSLAITNMNLLFFDGNIDGTVIEMLAEQ